MDMTGYIQNGGFGTNAPMQNFGSFMNPPQYPPNNIIQFGGGYQTPQQQQNQYVFQAVPQLDTNQNYYNPYANSYGNRTMNYNPYGLDYNYGQQYYGYQPQYGYGYQNPYGYQTMTSYVNRRQEQVELSKIKQRAYNKYFGIQMSEEELDKMFNPMNTANRITEEEANKQREYTELMQIQQMANNPQQYVSTQQAMGYKVINEMNQFRQQYDNHSMCQFLEDDFWKLQKQQWIELHCKPNNGRDMSDTYNSSQYNELLNMHRSSNPYINQLMDQSRYDNNKDDMEIGMNAVMDRERRRQQILRGAVPDFISSPETQEARRQWTQQVLNQIYDKEASKNV